MRVVFMGTPAFAVPSLEALSLNHEVLLVVTRPDRASGRGAHARAGAVKAFASAAGLPVEQPATLRGESARLSALEPDAICVAAFGMLLPPEVLAIPRFGCINVHASLLPKYRGAAPIQRAILAGERETGVSIMRMAEGLDTGPFALQRRVAIDDRYAEEVEADLARVGAESLLQVLHVIEDGTVRWEEQDEALATYAAKLGKDDVALRPELDVDEAFARVRAASRRAPARACVGDRELTIVRVTPQHHAVVAPGVLCVHEGQPHLGFADGSLRLDVVRPSGKGDMPGRDWVRGARLAEDTCWRCTR